MMIKNIHNLILLTATFSGLNCTSLMNVCDSASSHLYKFFTSDMLFDLSSTSKGFRDGPTKFMKDVIKSCDNNPQDLIDKYGAFVLIIKPDIIGTGMESDDSLRKSLKDSIHRSYLNLSIKRKKALITVLSTKGHVINNFKHTYS